MARPKKLDAVDHNRIKSYEGDALSDLQSGINKGFAHIGVIWVLLGAKPMQALLISD